MKHRVAIAWGVGIVACLAATGRAEPAVRIDAVEVGYSNFFRPGHMVPVFVKLTNTLTVPFNGELRAVQTDDDGDRLHWRIPAPLAPDSTQWRHVLICPPPDAMADGTVSISIGSIAGRGYRPVASVDLGLSSVAPQGALSSLPVPLDGERTIGVIGLGLGHFGVLNTPATFPTGEPVQVVVVAPKRMPSMWQGLDMLDVLYWDDPRPDDLDDDQRQALAQWVWRGGHLIIGLGPNAPELGSRGSALTEILPVTVAETGVRVEDVGPLHGALGGVPRAGAAVVARVVPRKGAHVLARDPAQALPLMCRWAKGAGSVTVLSTTLAEAKFHTRGALANATMLARLAGLYEGSVNPTEYYRPRAVVTDGLSTHLDSPGVGGTIVLTVILMCLAYAVIAGPGTWFYSRAKGQRHLSWWTFGAVVLVATLASVLLSLFGIRGETIHSAVVLDLANGSNYGVVQGHIGLYIPAHRSTVVQMGTDPEASVIPMIHPGAGSFGGYPDEKSYDLDLTEPTELTVPVRRTIKRLALSWRGDVGYNVAGSAQVVPATDSAAEIDDIICTITNNLPEPLTNAILIYPPRGRTRQIAVASVGDLPSGKTVQFGNFDAPAGRSWKTLTVQPLAKFHDALARRMGLSSHLATGTGGFLDQIRMLSTMSRYEQPTDTSRPVVKRLCYMRLDRLDQVHSGQALLIGQARGYLPAPVRVDGDSVDNQGQTVVRVLIPLTGSAPSAPAAAREVTSDSKE